MSDGAELPPGTLLGAYRIIRCIGIGGMGAVYEAEHRELDKRVALKTPFTEAGLSPEGRARFVQEGKTVSRIRHPHVVDITDVGEIDDTAYLVMEYLEGETLADLMRRDGPLAAPLVADILVPVASALHEAHSLGIVHRDMKPDNIFLTQSVHGNIHPKLLDFGISKVLGETTSPRLTHFNTILGTPSYVSPEQLEDAHATTALSDQYSLGVVIYEAATGQNPFAHHTTLVSMLNAVSKGVFRRPLEVNPGVDARLMAIALRAMSVAPEARFPSMAVMGAALLPLASADTRTAWSRHLVTNAAATLAPSGAAGAAQPRRAPARRSAWWWAAAAAFPLLGIGVAALRSPELVVDDGSVHDGSVHDGSVVRQALTRAPSPAPSAAPRAAQPEPPPRAAEPAAPVAAEPAARPALPGSAQTPATAEPAQPVPSGAVASTEPAPDTDERQAPAASTSAARAPVSARPRRGSQQRVARTSARDETAEPARARADESNRERGPAARATLDRTTKAGSDTLKTDNVDPWAP